MHTRLSAIAIAGTLILGLGTPAAFAQTPTDSFFDIFTEVEFPDPKCDPCDAIRLEIAEKQRLMEDRAVELGMIEWTMPLIDSFLASMKEGASDAQKALEEFDNPKNFVEDSATGRRYDSSDRAAMQRRSANLWNAYRGGDITAQEYSDAIGKAFDDPDVQEELDGLKREIRKELEKAVAEAKEVLQELQARHDAMQRRADSLRKEIDALAAEIAALEAKLADCEKRCVKEVIDVPKDYDLKPDEGPGFFGGIAEWFAGLFGGGGDEEDEDKGLDPLDRDFFGEDKGKDALPPGVEDGIVDGLGNPPADDAPKGNVTDSFFDIFVDLKLEPPVCRVCDPLFRELERLKKDLADTEREIAIVRTELRAVNNKLADARSAKADAEKALKEFDNPKNFAEDADTGRRFDSSDRAAMQRRNANLWKEYKSGDLSAEGLEAEWAKPFDDPSIQPELERIRAEIRAELEGDIEAADAQITRLEIAQRGLSRDSSVLGDLTVELKLQIDILQREYDDCLKKCRQPVLAPKDVEVLIERVDEQMKDDGETEDFSEDPEIDDDENDGAEEATMKPVEEETDGEETDAGWSCEWFGLFCPPSDDTAAEVVNGPKECDAPAVPMSSCKSTCSTECTPSGVRIWIEGNEIKVEECAICKPLHIDMCPTGMYFDKAECEKDLKCTCAEKAKSNDGLPCYACKDKSMEGTQAAEKCSPPTETESECRKECFGICTKKYERKDGVGCFDCTLPPSSTATETDARTVAPKVISTTPGNGGTDVPIDVRVRIVFSAPMLRSAVQTAIGASFPYTFEMVNGTTVDLVLNNGLAYDKSYDFRISGSATNMNGTPLGQTVTVQFRTQKKPTDAPEQPSGTPVPVQIDSLPPRVPASSAKEATAASTAPKSTVQILVISGKKYPVSQFIVEDHDDCTAHYHAANGVMVTSLDSNSLPEPGGCTGYGKVPDVPKQTCTTDGSECF